jgi:transposase InsO family protein
VKIKKNRLGFVGKRIIKEKCPGTGIREVRALTEEWIEEYNERRPHEALQNRTPSEWKQQIQP